MTFGFWDVFLPMFLIVSTYRMIDADRFAEDFEVRVLIFLIVLVANVVNIFQ